MSFIPNPLDSTQVADAFNEIASFGSEYTETYNQPKPEEAAAQGDQSRLASSLQAEGFTSSTQSVDVRAFFEQAGVDTDAPEIQFIIQNFQQQLDANDETAKGLLPIIAQQMAAKYPSTPQTAYSSALAASGFTDPFPAPELTNAGQTLAMHRPGLDPSELRGTPLSAQPRFETQPDTGWVRFRNDVLVDMSAGQVYYSPGSNAPGSPWWQQKVASSWSPEKVTEWRKKLHQYGYLTEDQAKIASVDQSFLGALAAYHNARYLNGGKPVAGDLAATGAGGSTGPKPVNLADFSAQIRNDVREQYKRVYGVDPSDGEVQSWSDYIIKQGMSLQRKFIGKYDSPMTDTAASEAEERFVEKIEQSPQGQFLSQSEEENTRLRDTFERMAVVTQSLSS